MTAHADVLYLPILTPARIEVSPSIARDESFKSHTRPKRYHTYVAPRPTSEVAYGPDGRLAANSPTGGIIDIFA